MTTAPSAKRNGGRWRKSFRNPIFANVLNKDEIQGESRNKFYDLPYSLDL